MNIQIVNHGYWLMFGISAKKSFGDVRDDKDDTFYGVDINGFNRVHGNPGSGKAKRKREKDMEYLRKLKEVEVDIYVDDIKGVFKACIVGQSSQDKEIFIQGIDKSGNKEGWIPHLILDDEAIPEIQNIQIKQIGEEMYGKKEIFWK